MDYIYIANWTQTFEMQKGILIWSLKKSLCSAMKRASFNQKMYTY